MRNGWKTFAIGASADKCGGDTGYRLGTGKKKSEVYVGIEPPVDAENWTQDLDTLDTWFSSWLWAYETMDVETRKKFYPTSALVTAPDIIFFWVARMIIAGLGVQAREVRPHRGQYCLPRCLFYRPHSRQTRSQDVEVVG